VSESAGRYFFALYENPSEVTPFYIDDPGQLKFLSRYLIRGNRIEVELPPGGSPYNVVATFLARRGWKAFISGQPVPIEASEESFMRLHVPPAREGRTLLLKYEPYSTAWLLGCFAVSLGGAGCLCWSLRRNSNTAPAGGRTRPSPPRRRQPTRGSP
jgi:hypothetical protein